MKTRILHAGISLSLLAGCAGSVAPDDPVAQQAMAASRERLVSEAPGKETVLAPLTPEQFLSLPEEYRRELDAQVMIHEREPDRYEALRKWAFDDIQEQFDYDPAFTSPIDELDESGRINCFSFSNLFVAAARYAEIEAHFQLVDSPPEWDMNQDTWLVSQHINVTGEVVRKLTDKERRYLRELSRETGSRIRTRPKADMLTSYVADLNPDIAVDSYRARIITDQQALSLFYSNRSVERLLRGEDDTAFQLGQLAVLADDQSGTAWNNMGGLYSRGGRLEEARDAYVTALALDPDAESPANNLERVYRRLGDVEKADAMARRIAANRAKNPYYHYAMGESMLARGDLEDAQDHFEDAIDRKDDERLFYYALADTQIRTGRYRRASRNLEAAKEHSSNRDLWRYNELYSKLRSARNGG